MQKLFILISVLLLAETGYSQTDSLPRGGIGYHLTKAIEKSREKKYNEAIAIVDSVLLIDSTKDNIYSLKAEFLWMKRDYHNAALFYKRAMSLDTDSSWLKGAHLFLGVLYEKAGNCEEAQRHYLKAIYLFENVKRQNDRFFEHSNIIDYAVALKLSGIEKEWEGLMSEPRFNKYHELYKGQSREEVLDKFWKEYDGG